MSGFAATDVTMDVSFTHDSARYLLIFRSALVTLLLLLTHTPRAYDSARALRLCGPSTHCEHTENRALSAVG